MSTSTAALPPPSTALLLMELRALPELAAFVAALPWLASAPRGDGHPVLVLPGLVTSDNSTRPLRTFLSNQGYAAYGWELGRNFGPLPGVERRMVEKIDELYATHGRKVSLVGWSLGGIYARQLAKMLPDKVRQVITLGSPFNGHPRATNAWRVYEYTSGSKVDHNEQHMGGKIAEPPSVPTTAIYSRTDGICAWQCCVETEATERENIEVLGSHCGLGHHPAAVYAIADRLSQPEGSWTKFDRMGWRSMLYPPPVTA
ncbi:MAG: alpha/beta hydrolase, partial [Alphaproteobacteria bacterium]